MRNPTPEDLRALAKHVREMEDGYENHLSHELSDFRDAGGHPADLARIIDELARERVAQAFEAAAERMEKADG